MPDSKEIDIYTELLDTFKPFRHIALTVPFVAFVVSITGRQRFIRFDRSGKILGAYSIFVHAPANPDNQAIAGFPIKTAMRNSWSRWRAHHMALYA